MENEDAMDNFPYHPSQTPTPNTDLLVRGLRVLRATHANVCIRRLCMHLMQSCA